MSQRLVALLPLCGGSTKLPELSLKIVAGKQLYRWALDEALASNIFAECVVWTDSEAVGADVSARYGGKVRVATRPMGGQATTAGKTEAEVAMLDFAKDAANNFTALCLVQVTSPMTTRDDLKAARQLWETAKADCLVSVTESRRLFWREGGNAETATQSENGAFYFASRDILNKEQRLGGRVVTYAMPKDSSYAIEESGDVQIVGQMLAARRVFPTAMAAQIRAIVVDVDGTLTDGGMYYSADGEMMKKFDTRDAHGLKMLERNGIKIGVITAEDSAVVSARMKKLAFEFYHRGIKDKWPTLLQFCEAAKVKPEEVLYVGDDEGDLDVMGRVGFAACPADAQPMIQNISQYVASKPGGCGAVREICNLVYAAKGL